MGDFEENGSEVPRQAVSGKERIDWRNDPAPDLVLEIDVTSYLEVQDYLPFRVPEVWLFRSKQLLVYQLQGDEYVVQSQSRYFPSVNLAGSLLNVRRLLTNVTPVLQFEI